MYTLIKPIFMITFLKYIMSYALLHTKQDCTTLHDTTVSIRKSLAFKPLRRYVLMAALFGFLAGYILLDKHDDFAIGYLFKFCFGWNDFNWITKYENK